jgi:hypothetical protein
VFEFTNDAADRAAAQAAAGASNGAMDLQARLTDPISTVYFEVFQGIS